MKLLIVDDEEMTREGLIKSLPWEDIGITEIYQAKDGLQGLALARDQHPQIILCDIRMPRMDGLTMLERIHDLLPDTVFVMLTGHAEVEYLKKAISLNVIRYIEKPINIEDLTEALKKAVERAIRYERQQEYAQIHSTVVASRLAYQMTFPYESCREIVDSLLQDFLKHYGTDKFQYITTFIVRPEHISENSMLLYSIGQKLHDRLIPGHYHIIYTDRTPQTIVYHIYGAILPSSSTLQMIGEILLSYYSSHTRSYVSVGRPVKGIRNAWHSYESARDMLEYARYYEENTVLVSENPPVSEEDNRAFHMEDGLSSLTDSISALPARYRAALLDKEEEEAMNLLEEFKGLWYHGRCRDSVVKSTCYSMLMILNQTYDTLHIHRDIDVSIEYPGLIIDTIDSAFNYLEVYRMLREKTAAFFHQLSHLQDEDSTIYRIKEYINTHYRDQDLSVKSISENVFLSVSYLCTYFKNETGITLNQYITDYRMKKAMHLLADTNMKIVDVSKTVGYRDSNYFAKIFKKQTGLSPKEYKNKSTT